SGSGVRSAKKGGKAQGGQAGVGYKGSTEPG
nr:RecName: Full=Cytochrome b6/f complex 12.6 kDa peptide [Euglena gracilis]